MPAFEVLHVVVVQQGKQTDGVAAQGEPLKDSVNWTAVLEAGRRASRSGTAEALGVEIRVDPSRSPRGRRR